MAMAKKPHPLQLKLPELASVCSERRPEAPADWHDCDTQTSKQKHTPSENRHKVEVEFCWINYSSKYIKIISKHRVNSSSENCGSVRFLSCGLQWHAVTYGHQSLSPISVPFGLRERNQIFLQFPQLRRNPSEDLQTTNDLFASHLLPSIKLILAVTIPEPYWKSSDKPQYRRCLAGLLSLLSLL